MTVIRTKSIDLLNGETIGYKERSGGNNVVILIHGNMTSSVHWDVVLETLPESYKVYAIDLRGFGKSSYSKKINSIKDFSDDIKVFVDMLGLNKFSLVGWSLGGAVSQMFCAYYPKYCERLILLASVSSRGYPYYYTKENGMPDFTRRIDSLEDIYEDHKFNQVQGAYQRKDASFLKQMWNKLIYTVNKPNDIQYRKYLDDMMTQRNLAECYHALNMFNISVHHNGLVAGDGKVNRINMPIKIIYGEQDLVITKEMVNELREDYGAAEYVELKKCGHSPLIDNLSMLIFEIDKFLSV